MKRGTVAFAALEAALLLAVPVLAWIGFRTVLDTTSGQAVDPELDPAEPGYEAFLEPTPVSLVVGTDAEGALSWLTVLALGGPAEQGGAVIFVPSTTVTEASGLGEVPLTEAWAEGGQPAVAAAVADLLGAGFEEVLVLEPPRLAELLGPVAPLEVVLADDVPGFDAGEVSVDGAGVAELLTAAASDESDLTRLARHEAVWQAWLAAVSASSDPDVVPGERASGIGRSVRGLAAGAVSYDVIPVAAVDGPAAGGVADTAGDEIFDADPDAVRALVADRVPFPVASRPGGRPRVRVLDGVGVEGLALRVARDVVQAGGQVTVLGNADRFDAAASRVVFFDAGVTDAAEAVAQALGILDVSRASGPNPNDLVDITVVVGSDLAGAYGLSGG